MLAALWGVLGLLAVVGTVRPAWAIRYMSDEEAVHFALGEGVEVTAESRTIDAELAARLFEFTGLGVEPGETVTVRVGRDPETGELAGYAWLLTEKTRFRPITFIVGVSPAGEITRTAVVVYREPRGEQVKARRFNAQYEGKTIDDELRVGRSIRSVSGATVSAEVMTGGVKKALLLTQEMFLKAAPRYRAGTTVTGETKGTVQ